MGNGFRQVPSPTKIVVRQARRALTKKVQVAPWSRNLADAQNPQTARITGNSVSALIVKQQAVKQVAVAALLQIQARKGVAAQKVANVYTSSQNAPNVVARNSDGLFHC